MGEQTGAELGLLPTGAGVFVVGENGDAEDFEPGKKLRGITLPVEDHSQTPHPYRRWGFGGFDAGITEMAAVYQPTASPNIYNALGIAALPAAPYGRICAFP